MKIKEYLQNNILITDGAMGTYYAKMSGDYENPCELANLSNPSLIEEIHKQYIEAGAQLLRTNTFSANSFYLGMSHVEVKGLLQKGFQIAKDAVGHREVYIACSIGPINSTTLEKSEEEIISEYVFIVDSLLEVGAEIFLFETFSSTTFLKTVSEYIKRQNPDAFIFTHFALMPDGYTREGLGLRSLVEEVKQISTIDIYGFNCGSGPSHLLQQVRNLSLEGETISVLPNAGYPEILNERTIYVDNPAYFADKMWEMKNLGVKILGGCCGTTPTHIQEMVKVISKASVISMVTQKDTVIDSKTSVVIENRFRKKLEHHEFVLAVELDPPFDTSIDKIMEGAKICKEHGIDLITIADSPMSKVRVDSISMATKIKREIGIDTMPHICCRDKNSNAIRSGLLAAHIEGIRNVLAVTGDPVSTEERSSIKSVFNLNSYKLISLISQMNEEVLGEDSYHIGGALNLNARHRDLEVNRMLKKAEHGATMFLTQPIYEDETIEYLKTLKRDGVKILGGILPIVSYRNAQFLNNELPGVHVPEEYCSRFHKEMTKEEAEDVGIEMAVEIANKIIPYVDGLYFMTPFNRVNMIMKIIERLELGER